MLKQSDFVKIRTAVPVESVEKVRKALGEAGAGKQGNYSHCSASYRCTGRFTPVKGANPTIGEVDKPEEVSEEIIEMLCHRDILENVVQMLKQAHPYEEPAIDILVRYEVE